MKQGVVRVTTAGSFTNSEAMVTWYGEEDKNKILKKGINLSLEAEGYYCEECMEVIACFEER